MELEDILPQVEDIIGTRKDGSKYLKLNLFDLSFYLEICSNCKHYSEQEKKEIIYALNSATKCVQKIIGIYYLTLKTYNISLRDPNKIDVSERMLYTETSVEYFIIIYRKIFDFIAQVLNFTFQDRKSINKFGGLINYISNNDKTGIDNDTLKLFCELKNIYIKFNDLRNYIIHENGFVLVTLGNNDSEIHILPLKDFYTSHEFDNEIYIVNENKVIDFELFGAYYICYLLYFLKILASILEKKTGINVKSTSEVGSYGLVYLQNAINKLRDGSS